MAEMSSVGGVQIVPGTTQFARTHTFKNLGGWYRLGILHPWHKVSILGESIAYKVNAQVSEILSVLMNCDNYCNVTI
jgi:hypothetical protein